MLFFVGFSFSLMILFCFLAIFFSYNRIFLFHTLNQYFYCWGLCLLMLLNLFYFLFYFCLSFVLVIVYSFILILILRIVSSLISILLCFVGMELCIFHILLGNLFLLHLLLRLYFLCLCVMWNCDFFFKDYVLLTNIFTY